jgi:hypothetical protein
MNIKTYLIITLVIFLNCIQIQSIKIKVQSQSKGYINDNIGNFFSGIFSKSGNSIFGNNDLNTFTKSTISFPNASQRILGINQVGINPPPEVISKPVGGLIKDPTIVPVNVGKTIVGSTTPQEIVIAPPQTIVSTSPVQQAPVISPTVTIGSPAQVNYLPDRIGKSVYSGFIPHGKGKYIGSPDPVYTPVPILDRVATIDTPRIIEKPEELTEVPATLPDVTEENSSDLSHGSWEENNDEKPEMDLPFNLLVID